MCETEFVNIAILATCRMANAGHMQKQGRDSVDHDLSCKHLRV